MIICLSIYLSILYLSISIYLHLSTNNCIVIFFSFNLLKKIHLGGLWWLPEGNVLIKSFHLNNQQQIVNHEISNLIKTIFSFYFSCTFYRRSCKGICYLPSSSSSLLSSLSKLKRRETRKIHYYQKRLSNTNYSYTWMQLVHYSTQYSYTVYYNCLPYICSNSTFPLTNKLWPLFYKFIENLGHGIKLQLLDTLFLLNQDNPKILALPLGVQIMQPLVSISSTDHCCKKENYQNAFKLFQIQMIYVKTAIKLLHYRKRKCY